MQFNTVKKFLCTLAIGVALLLGMAISTQAQGPPSHAPAYGRRYGPRYGQRVRARVHYRNALRRDLRLRHRAERRVFNNRVRTARVNYGNTRYWRDQRKRDRKALKLHQRSERREFRERYNNRGRGRN